jgi:hypothetical protein
VKPSLLNDVLFKIVFGSPESEPVLVPMLNVILGLQGSGLYALKYSGEFLQADQPIPAFMQEQEGVAMAINSMRKAYAGSEVREMMLAQEKYERDQVSRLHEARLEGKLEGKLEGARELIKDGLALEKVAKLSGISFEEFRSRWGTDLPD